MENDIKLLKTYLNESSEIVVFTGAGISTESGISDYRSKGGIWEKFQPVTIQEFLADEEKRKEYWRRKVELYETMREAKPNQGHMRIVELEKRGKLKGLITQNIDGLHQDAGTSPEKILELHGTGREIICLSCGDITTPQEAYELIQSGVEIPLCKKCNGFLKPNTISFGQTLDQNVLQQAFDWAASCDLLLAIGSTLIVEPAASIPRVAKQQGAKLVIITMSETPLDNYADLKFEDSAGKVLSAVID